MTLLAHAPSIKYAHLSFVIKFHKTSRAAVSLHVVEDILLPLSDNWWTFSIFCDEPGSWWICFSYLEYQFAVFLLSMWLLCAKLVRWALFRCWMLTASVNGMDGLRHFVIKPPHAAFGLRMSSILCTRVGLCVCALVGHTLSRDWLYLDW